MRVARFGGAEVAVRRRRRPEAAHVLECGGRAEVGRRRAERNAEELPLGRWRLRHEAVGRSAVPCHSALRPGVVRDEARVVVGVAVERVSGEALQPKCRAGDRGAGRDRGEVEAEQAVRRAGAAAVGRGAAVDVEGGLRAVRDGGVGGAHERVGLGCQRDAGCERARRRHRDGADNDREQELSPHGTTLAVPSTYCKRRRSRLTHLRRRHRARGRASPPASASAPASGPPLPRCRRSSGAPVQAGARAPPRARVRAVSRSRRGACPMRRRARTRSAPSPRSPASRPMSSTRNASAHLSSYSRYARRLSA